jgi:hypothetical protein
MPNENSVRTYTHSLAGLARDLGYQTIPDGTAWLEDHVKVFKAIKTTPSPNTWNSKLFAIKYFLDIHDAPELLEEYEILISIVKEQIEDARSNKKTDKETANWMSKGQLLSVLEDLRKSCRNSITNLPEYKNVMKYLCLKIHIETPLRNDLCNSKIYIDPHKELLENKNFNYIILDTADKKAYFIDNVYKMKDRHGTLKIEWTDPIYKELVKYYNDIIGFKSVDNYFIVNQNGDKMTPNNYTKFINSIFKPYGKSISTSMIRHIIVSEVYELDEAKEIEKVKLARIMGHTTDVAAKIYAKY